MREEFEEERTESFDIRKYVVIAKRRLLYFFVPLFVGWGLLWGASWMLPSVYRSGTLILVEQPSVPSQFVVPNIAGNLQDRLQTMTEQILSRTRLLHIIETLNLYANKRQRMSTDEIVERMRKDIEIELVRSPGRDAVTSFNVYYSSSDPLLAQHVTNELTNLFINENLEARQEQSESTTKFLERQLEDARVILAEQEDKIRRYKDQHLGELPGQLQSNLQVLAGLQSQLQSENDALNRAKQQNVYLQSLLAQYRSVQNAAKAGTDVPVGLPALEQELDRLRAQLADLTSRYTDRYPDVRKVKEQIARAEQLKVKIDADLKARLTAAQSGDATDAGASSSAEIPETTPSLELKSQLKVNELEIQNREHAIQALQAKINDYQARLNQEPVREQQLTELTRGYDQSKANYDSLLAKKNSSELATNLEMEQKSEHFRILDPPSLPQKPFSPNRMKLCGIGLALGLLLGAVGVAGSEVLDDRIYTDEELKKLLPAVILSDIPEISTAREQRKLQHKQRLEWLAAGVLFVLMLAGSTISVFRG
jgi:polysaccharide biosynthesis transport protein